MSPTPNQGSESGDRLRLDVLVVNDFARVTGGSDRVALAEAAGLARRGHRVTLIAGHGGPDTELAAAGVTVRITGQQTTLGDPRRLRAAVRGIWNRQAARLVWELAGRAERPAVVHVHGFTKVLSSSVIRAAVGSGLPVIVTLHDYFATCPNGAFFNYPRGEVCTLRPLSPRCVATDCDARAYRHKLWRVARTSVQQSFGLMPAGVHALLIPSQRAAEIMHPYLPEGVGLAVLPNPVDVSRMPPVEPATNTEFVFVGRLEVEKGPVLLARAARKASVPATFIGAGEQAAAIRRAFPQAELTGWLDGPRIESLIRTARAVVFPSLGYEVQGLVPLEAAAHGVPAVVSNASVARDAVADGVSGLWFRSGDEDHLAEKLATLSRNPDLAVRLGRAAYERFWSDPPEMGMHLDRLESIYNTALSRSC